MKNKILLIIITLLGSNVASSQNELVVGKMAPNINITDYIFNTPSDKNFKNKFILLEFWATWCGPCLEEVPSLNKLQEKFKSKKDFVFISITNEKPDKVLRTLKRIPFNSIVVSDPQAILVFKYIGYVAQEVAVGGRKTVDVILKADQSDLSEIVVVGYGTQKKVNLSGAVDQVNAKTLASRPIANVAQGLLV